MPSRVTDAPRRENDALINFLVPTRFSTQENAFRDAPIHKKRKGRDIEKDSRAIFANGASKVGGRRRTVSARERGGRKKTGKGRRKKNHRERYRQLKTFAISVYCVFHSHECPLTYIDFSRIYRLRETRSLSQASRSCTCTLLIRPTVLYARLRRDLCGKSSPEKCGIEKKKKKNNVVLW